jgi:hypothetical protein
MGVGSLICVVGIAITVGSYEMAASSPGGGSYLLAWGAIVFGGVRFLKGVILFCKA